MGMPIVTARLLGPDGFHEYIVAVSMMTLLATFCEFGTGKVALKLIPDYYQKKEWPRALGFWRFSLAISLSISLLIAVAVVGYEWGHDQDFGDYLLGIAVLFLPPTVMCAVVSEFVIANRATVRGTLVTKVICPVTTFVLLITVFSIRGSLDETIAIMCFGFSGVVGLLFALYFFYRSAPGEVLAAEPERERPSWIRHCAWFVVISLAMSWLAEISLIVMEFADVASIEIARFGAALKTGSIILLVAKSTNKFYQPIMSNIMSSKDWDLLLKIRDKRLRFIGAISIAFVIVIIVFGEQILSLYGPEYREAYHCLVMIAIGTSTFNTFSMAPEFLKFSKQYKRVLGIQITIGIIMAGLTWWLGRAYGSYGAGMAVSISLLAMSLAFLFLTRLRVQDVLMEQAEGESDEV